MVAQLLDTILIALAFIRATLAQLSARIEEITPTGERIVNNLSDLPAAVNGAITLEAGVSYVFNRELDLNGARLILGAATGLRGTNSEAAILKSTGLAPETPFITAESGGPNPIRHLAIEGVGTVLYIDGQGGSNAALDWYAFNLIGCGAVGTIRDITNLVVSDSAWNNTGGLSFDGSIGTVAFFQTLWTLPEGSGKTALTLPATLTITRRFRWTYSPMVVPVGCTGIDIADRDATFPIAETFGILFGNFSGGGSYLSGASYADDRTVIQSTIGLVNASPSAFVYMVDNATPTAVAEVSTFYKIAGAPLAGPYLSKFTVDGNRATYTGSIPRFFRLAASAALTAGNNNQIAFRFAVNGQTLADTNQKTTASSAGRAESVPILGTVQLGPGDFVELFTANLSAAADITVTDMQLNVSAVAG